MTSQHVIGAFVGIAIALVVLYLLAPFLKLLAGNVFFIKYDCDEKKVTLGVSFVPGGAIHSVWVKVYAGTPASIPTDPTTEATQATKVLGKYVAQYDGWPPPPYGLCKIYWWVERPAGHYTISDDDATCGGP
jgi:hypothetical protein